MVDPNDRNQTQTDTRPREQMVFVGGGVQLDRIKQLPANVSLADLSAFVRQVGNAIDNNGNLLPGRKITVRSLEDGTERQRPLVVSVPDGEDPRDVVTIPDVVRMVGQAAAQLKARDPEQFKDLGSEAGIQTGDELILDWAEATQSGSGAELNLASLSRHGLDLKNLVGDMSQSMLQYMFAHPETEQPTEEVPTESQDEQSAESTATESSTPVFGSAKLVTPQTEVADGGAAETAQPATELPSIYDTDNARREARQQRRDQKPAWYLKQQAVSRATDLVMIDILTDMGAFTQDQRDSLDPAVLAQIRSRVSQQVFARLEQGISIEDLTQHFDQTVFNLRVSVDQDVYNPQNTPQLTKLVTDLSRKVQGSQPHQFVDRPDTEVEQYLDLDTDSDQDTAVERDEIAQNIRDQDSTKEYRTRAERVGLGPHEAAGLEAFAERFIQQHGSESFNQLNQMDAGTLQRELAKEGVTIEFLSDSSVGKLLNYTRAYTLKRTNELEALDPIQFTAQAEQVTEVWNEATQSERAELLAQSSITASHPDYRQMLRDNTPPNEVLSDVQIVTQPDGTQTIANKPTNTVRLIAAEPVRENPMAGGALAAMLGDVLGESTVENIGVAARTDQYQLDQSRQSAAQTYAAEQLATATNSNTPDEFRQRASQAASEAQSSWQQNGQEFLRLLHPRATETEIQSMLAAGPTTAYITLTAAGGDKLHQVMQTAKQSVGVANTEWRNLQKQGQLLEYLQHLHPSVPVQQLQELAQSPFADPEFAAFLITHDNKLEEATRTIRESRNSAAEIWDKQLSADQKRNLALRHNSFASEAELEAYLNSSEPYSDLATLFSEGYSAESVTALADYTKPSAQQLWLVANQEERAQLVAKTYGADRDDIQEIAQYSEVPLAVASSLQKNGSVSRALVDPQLNPTNTASAQTSINSSQVDNALSALTPAEQQALLLGVGHQALDLPETQRQLLLKEIVAGHLSQGNPPQRIKLVAQQSSEFAPAQLATAPEPARTLISSLFEGQIDGAENARHFLDLHNGDITAAVETATSITAQWMRIKNTPAEAHYYQNVLGLSSDEAVKLLQQSSNTPPSWFTSLTNNGRSSRAVETLITQGYANPNAIWATMSDAKKGVLLNAAGHNPDIISSSPPDELVFELLTTQPKPAQPSVTELWRATPARLKKAWLMEQGLTEEQALAIVSDTVPPADFVALADEGGYEAKTVVERMTQATSPISTQQRELAQRTQKVIAGYREQLDADPEIADDAAKFGVIHGRKRGEAATNGKKPTRKQKEFTDSYTLFRQYLNDNTVSNAEKEAFIRSVGIKIKDGSLHKKNLEEIDTLCAQMVNMPGVFGKPGLAMVALASFKDKKFEKLSKNLQEVRAGERPAEKVREGLSQEENHFLDGFFADGSSSQQRQSSIQLLASFSGNKKLQEYADAFTEMYLQEEEETKFSEMVQSLYSMAQTDEQRQAYTVIHKLILQYELGQEQDQLQQDLIAAQLHLLFLQKTAADSVEILDQQQAYIADLQARLFGIDQTLQGLYNSTPDGFSPELIGDDGMFDMAAYDMAVLDGAIDPGMYPGSETIPQRGGFSRVREFVGRKLGLSPKQKLRMAMRTASKKLMAKFGKNAAMKAALKLAGGPAGWAMTAASLLGNSESSKRLRRLVGGALIGTGAALASNLAWMGAAMGAGIGSMFFGPVGAAIGGTVGYGIGSGLQYFGFKSPFVGSASGSSLGGGSGLGSGGLGGGSGAAGTSSSYSNALQAKLAPSQFQSGGTAAAAEPVAAQGAPPPPGLEGATPVVPATTAAATTATAGGSFIASLGTSILTMGILAPALWIGFSGLIALYFLLVISGAFIVPVPTDNISTATTSTSKYLDIDKIATPKSLPNNSNSEVRYNIALKPKRGATIQITEIRDSMTTLSGEGSEEPTVTENGEVLIPNGGELKLTSANIETFGTDPFAAPKLYSYTVTVDGGVDIYVNNTITVIFDVLKDGEVIASSQQLPHTTSLKIGNPKVNCWPTTGSITQFPYGPVSHIQFNSDAFDIGAPQQTPIYSPRPGTADVPAFDGVYFGWHVYVNFDLNGDGIEDDRMLFAHMWKPPDVSNGQTVGVGTKLGEVGTTGNSTGNHLHWELYTSSGIKLRSLVENGDSLYLGQPVSTCW